MRQEIKSIGELQAAVPKMDEAVEVNLKVIQNNHDLKNFKGVWNVTQDKMANVVTSRYRIIQNRIIFSTVCETLSRLNMDVKGLLKSYNHTTCADLRFKGKNKTIVKDDKKGIEIGIRVMNSYDKTSSFRMEMFGYRLICSNGMVLGKALNNIRQITFHTGEEKTKEIIAEKVEDFVTAVINSSGELKAYIEECLVDSMEFQSMKLLLKHLVRHKKHREEIQHRLEGKTITRWELYNAITNYATHGKQLTPYMEEKMQGIAQNVLRTGLPILVSNVPEDKGGKDAGKSE